MRKLAAFVLAAGLLLGGTARADDMYVPGLGTLPFSAAVQVKDGDGTAVEQMFRKSLAYPAAAGTKRAAFMRFLSTPEGWPWQTARQSRRRRSPGCISW